MAEVHLITGVALIAANAAAGIWGAAAWLQGRPSIGFWYALRIAQAVVMLQVLFGGILVFSDREAVELHYVYGLLPLFVSFLAELIRAGAAQQELGELDFQSLPEQRQQAVAMAIVRREMGIMAVACLVIVFLGLRAAGTSSVF